MEIVISILVSATAFFLAAKFLRGVTINGFVEAIIVAIVIAGLNFFLGTFLKIITLGILSIGVFTLLLDAILIQVADYFLKGMKVQNFWWALALALIVSVIDAVIRWVF
ncbi:MAG: putative membrane protein [Paraglaciecola sp.]|jgi:putative membrane protein